MYRLNGRGAGKLILVSTAALSLAACGGGGGGSGGTTGTATPSPTPPATTTPTPVGPSTSSAEYQRNWGVAGVKAEAAWQQGASGSGIMVSVIDSGANPNEADLVGRVISVDINSSRNQPVGSSAHATQVTGIIASNYNNTGTVGVAFGATVLSIRADNSSGNFSTVDLANAIDYAVANGARVINLSVGTSGGPSGAAFEAALQRAVNAGVVFSMAAGNDASDAAHWPSGYAVDPRYAGSIMAVGSIGSGGALSSFSNRAGAAGGGFVVAPGEGVVTNCNTATCTQVTGTSFSAPHVTGSLALVLQAYPNLTGRQAVDLLFRTARDLGAPGNDSVYGWGAVDLQRAFAPVGSLSIPTETTVVAASLQPEAQMGAAFGDAVQASGVLQTVGWDAYQRPFETNLGGTYGAARPSILSATPSAARRTSDVELALEDGGQLNLAASVVDEPPAPSAASLPWAPREAGREVSIGYRKGRLGFTAWTGRSTGNPFGADTPDAFVALAQSDRAIRADYRLGRWRLSAEAGAGERHSIDLLEREDGARYGRVSGRTTVRGVVSTLSFGALSERMGPLGGYIPTGTGLELPARTAFASWNARWPLGDRFALSTQASVGHTRLQGAVMRLEEAAWSTAWSAELRGACAAFRLGCSQLSLTLAQPLRVESGRFAARLADPLTSYFAPVTYSDRGFAAAPSGRQLDLTFGVSQRTPFDGVLQLNAVASVEPGHRASEGPAYGVLATWRIGY